MFPAAASQEAPGGASPLPLLLLLDSSLSAWPWPLAVARAAVILQLPSLATHLAAPGVRGTIAYAVEWQRVERIVLCCEGSEASAPRSRSMNQLASELGAVLETIPLARARLRGVDVLCLDPATGALSSSTAPHAGRDTGHDGARLSPLELLIDELTRKRPHERVD